MNTLRQVSFIVLFIFILIFELLIGIIGEFPELRILPFLILLFYISSEKFSNSFVLAFFFSGIYYDLFYTSNYFGSTSAKFILLGIIVNFIYNKINQNINKILSNIIIKKDDLRNKIYFKNLLNEAIKSYAG